MVHALKCGKQKRIVEKQRIRQVFLRGFEQFKKGFSCVSRTYNTIELNSKGIVAGLVIAAVTLGISACQEKPKTEPDSKNQDTGYLDLDPSPYFYSDQNRAEELLEHNPLQGKRRLLDILKDLGEQPFGLSRIVRFSPDKYGHSPTDFEIEVAHTAIFDIIRLLGKHGVRGNRTVDSVLLSGINHLGTDYPGETWYVIRTSAALLKKYGSKAARQKARRYFISEIKSTGDTILKERYTLCLKELGV